MRTDEMLKVEDLAAEIERLRTALEPFTRNVNAISLRRALGHVTREHLWQAQRAYEQRGRDDDAH